MPLYAERHRHTPNQVCCYGNLRVGACYGNVSVSQYCEAHHQQMPCCRLNFVDLCCGGPLCYA